MSDFPKKTLEQAYVYNTAPKCPLCGGTMLPLNYLADGYFRCSDAWLYDEIPGNLKACNQCGIVKFYLDEKAEE